MNLIERQTAIYTLGLLQRIDNGDTLTEHVLQIFQDFS